MYLQFHLLTLKTRHWTIQRINTTRKASYKQRTRAFYTTIPGLLHLKRSLRGYRYPWAQICQSFQQATFDRFSDFAWAFLSLQKRTFSAFYRTLRKGLALIHFCVPISALKRREILDFPTHQHCSQNYICESFRVFFQPWILLSHREEYLVLLEALSSTEWYRTSNNQHLYTIPTDWLWCLFQQFPQIFLSDGNLYYFLLNNSHCQSTRLTCVTCT